MNGCVSDMNRRENEYAVEPERKTAKRLMVILIVAMTVLFCAASTANARAFVPHFQIIDYDIERVTIGGKRYYKLSRLELHGFTGHKFRHRIRCRGAKRDCFRARHKGRLREKRLPGGVKWSNMQYYMTKRANLYVIVYKFGRIGRIAGVEPFEYCDLDCEIDLYGGSTVPDLRLNSHGCVAPNIRRMSWSQCYKTRSDLDLSQLSCGGRSKKTIQRRDMLVKVCRRGNYSMKEVAL